MHPSPELREAVLDFYKALDANDVDALVRLQSSAPEALVIGAADSEWWADPEQAVEHLCAQCVHLPELTFEAGDIQAFQDDHGRTGCFADRVTIRGLGGSPVTARLSGVGVREEDGWKLLQSHLSIGTGT